jgi:hypothetical protein
MAALTSLTPSDNRPEHGPRAMSIRYNGHVRCTSAQLINQSKSKGTENVTKKRKGNQFVFLTLLGI